MYCFCGNTTSDFTQENMSVCNKSCTGDAEEICGSENADLMYTFEVDFIGSVESVKLNAENEIFKTTDYVKYEIVVNASCQWNAEIFLGDGTKSVYAGNMSTSFSVSRRYIIPGEYIVKVAIGDENGNSWVLSDTVIVRIESEKTEYSLTCPSVVKPFVNNICSLVVWKGTSISANFEMIDDNFLSEYDVPDPYYVSIGQPAPEENLLIEEIKTEEMILLSYAKVKTKSRFEGLEFQVASPGTFEFYILRPAETDQCSSSCDPWTIRHCSDDEALCSRNGQCIEDDPLPDCPAHQKDENNYKIIYSKEIDALESGYRYITSDFSSELDLFPGDILGFKAVENASLSYRKCSDDEINAGFQDTLQNETVGLGILHYMRIIAIEQANVSFQFSYNVTGNHSLSISLSDAWKTFHEKKNVLVQIPISNVSLELSSVDNIIGNDFEARILGIGSDFILYWDYSGKDEEEYFEALIPDEGIVKSASCKVPGKYIFTVILSNAWNSENASQAFNCFYPIGRNWSLNSNSPKSNPPGKVSFELKFNGKSLPTLATYSIDFGNGNSKDSKEIRSDDDDWSDTFSHSFSSQGNFTVYATIANKVDKEIFETIVFIFEKLGNLSVIPSFVKSGIFPDDSFELKGKNKSDAPIDSTLYFENMVSGHVTTFKMEFEDRSVDIISSKENVISYHFPEVGEWNLSFVALDSDVDEYSNTVMIPVRILAEVSDFGFNASTLESEVNELVEFTISITELDLYSCIIFNGDDGSRLQAFGNKEACTIYYKEDTFKFVKGSSESSRKTREIRDAYWKDDSTISILYNYMFGGKFLPSVDVFNSVSRLKKNVTLHISDGDFDTPLVWIDKNSTDIEQPIECERGRDYRCETTAIFRNNHSYLASHLWSAYEVDASGKEEEIDITNLKTHNCSAIRILTRYLDIGLYKLKYTLTIYAEDGAVSEDGEDLFYSETQESDEHDDYMSYLENRTILARRSVYTYLRIIKTPLVPMLVSGGASYVVRGFGQTISLEPTIYTEDPDYPEEKDFEVTWFCLRFENDESLVGVGPYEYDTRNPSSPITDRSTINDQEDEGGCFGKGPGLMQIGSSDYKLNGSSFWIEDTTYKVTGVIRKDNKVTEGQLYIKVIRGRPPSLRTMCDKKVTCFPHVRGTYINPSAWVSLRVECIQDCGDGDLHFKWNVFQSSLETLQRIPLDNWEEHVKVDSERIGLNQSLFAAYPNVDMFAVEATSISSNETIPDGISSIILLINHPPENGSCRISRTSGMALLDMFYVTFSDWVDREEHDIKDYSIYVQYEEEFLHLSYGLKTRVEVVLPYGGLEVWCAIEDYLGAVTMYSVANFSTMLPKEEEVDTFDKKRLYDKSLAEGRMALAVQFIIAKNSIIMEYRRRKGQLENFGDVGENEVMTRWKEYLALEGIDSSYYTSQAKDEIREMLRENLEKEMDRNAIIKNRELSRILRLPMEALPDAEIFGAALNAVAENGPTDMNGKIKIMRGLEEMYGIINQTDVPHPEDLKVAISQFGNLADIIAGSLAESNIAGNFLPYEVKQAEEELDYNATEPNSFIFYVEGNRQEVQDRLKTRAVDEAKVNQINNAKEMVTNIKTMISEIQQNCMEEIMIGPEPFYTSTKSGFQMTFIKNYASKLSNETIHQGDSSIILPDICNILTEVNCRDDHYAVGIQSVRWTQPLESYGGNSNILSESSNVIQIDITPREGNSTISINNSADPFIICIPVSKDSKSSEGMEYIVPEFSTDDDVLVYHTVYVDSPGVGVTVNIRPDNMSSPLLVVYKYEEHPSLQDYDGLVRLADIQIDDGIYSLFIGSDVITESGKNLTVGIGQIKSSTDEVVFKYPEKYNLTVVNMTNDFTTNYSIKVSTTGCYYFSDKEETWSTKGCQVINSVSGVTCCACNHLTSFGSGFFIKPNEIDFSYVFSHAGISNNITIYATIIVIFSVFIIFLIFARWKDRKDLEKLGATPLPDNEAGDKYIYEILVYTGNQRNAGTKSNVLFLVSGDDDETAVRHFHDDKRPILKKGAIDVFVMSTPRSLGQLNYLRIWHDNSGSGKWSSWYCRYIVFRDVQTGLKYEFIINKWFAVERDDGMIDRLIPVAGREQVTEFSHLFSTASQRNLSDNHLWFSIFLRPVRSRFTRVQRVCCCMAVLCLSMLSNAMYYQRTSAKPDSGGFKFGPLSLSPEQIAVGIVSNVLIFPPTFLMIFFFRKSRPRNLRPSRIEETLKQQRKDWKKKNAATNLIKPRKSSNKSDPEAQLYHRKRKFSLPWWCVYFGWIMVILAIGSSLFFMWAYGIEFGDEKTSKWLTSLVVAFFSSLLITQPIKIILMTIVVSCMCRSVDYDNDDADEDEADPYLKNDEEYMHDDLTQGQKKKRITYQPMDSEALNEARREREKEVKMYNVIREISTYFFFLWIITILSYGNRDPNNFYLREALINGFLKPGDIWVDYNDVNTEKRFWNWTYNALVPELFAAKWYNGRTPLGLRLYLDDRNNLKIGYAVLRQVRINPRSCKVAWLMESITPDCAGFGGMINEDGTLYTKGWQAVNSTETPVPPEYKYLSAAQLKGYPFWGQIDWYGGGGYVVPLVAKRDSDVDSLISRLHRIEKDGWIDKHTRAIFVEFGLYNAQINLFCAMTIVAEFLPGGGVIPYYHIDPLRLLNYHTGFGLLQMAVEILFVLFTIFFTFKEVSNMCRVGLSYFKEYWNIAEVVSIIVSYTGIINHIYKLFVIMEIMRIFTETEGTGYVKLQESVLLNELFCYQIGVIMSISTLKFLKLLRFNKRIGILSSTLRVCAQELQSYSVCLLVVFMAFVILFWLLLGRFVWEFSTFIYSFESSISMMLKKFNYEDMYAAQPVFTPIAFFTFSLATSLVLVNILLSIIIRSFENVKHDTSLQSNEYEILDFFVNRIKMATGIGSAKVRPLPSMYRDKKKPQDSVSSFPAKVDRLLDFINDFYFDNQMDLSGKEFLKKINTDASINLERGKRKARLVLKSKIPKSVSEQFDDF